MSYDMAFKKVSELRSKNAQLLIAVSILLILTTLVVSPVSAQNVGDLAPDFTLTDIDGNKFTLSSYRGGVVLLEFFATWCPGCVREVSELKVVQEKFGEGLVIISISVDPDKDTVEVLKQFRAKYGITWIIARDKAGVTNLYKVSGLPTLFIIDQEGIIRFKHTVLTYASDIVSELEQLGLPEFAAAIVFPLFMIATLAAAFLGRKMWLAKRKGFLIVK